MPTTPRGLIYPGSADHTRLWEHLQSLAESTDTALDEALAGEVSYVPVWTAGAAPSLGNGSIVGSYVEVGDGVGSLIHYRFRLETGSTSTYGSGAYQFSLPFPALSDTFEPMGTAVLQDVSAGNRLSRFLYGPAVSTSTVAMHDGSGNVVTNTVPWTWNTGDIITGSGTYRRGA